MAKGFFFFLLIYLLLECSFAQYWKILFNFKAAVKSGHF